MPILRLLAVRIRLLRWHLSQQFGRRVCQNRESEVLLPILNTLSWLEARIRQAVKRFSQVTMRCIVVKLRIHWLLQIRISFFCRSIKVYTYIILFHEAKLCRLVTPTKSQWHLLRLQSLLSLHVVIEWCRLEWTEGIVNVKLTHFTQIWLIVWCALVTKVMLLHEEAYRNHAAFSRSAIVWIKRI